MSVQARRSEVLSAAREAFHERGYEGTGTREIAARLGLLGGSLYYYIESKEALLFDVLMAVQAPGRASIERVRAQPGAALERLDRLIRDHVEATAADPVGIALTLSERRHLAPPEREQVTTALREYRLGFQELIAEGQSEGAIAPALDARVGALTLLGALNWMHRWYRPGGRLSREALGGRLSAILLGGIAPAGAPVPGAAALPPAAVSAPAEGRLAQVLQAAAELFASNGYEATTAQDIAERVGLQKPTLYHYVSSKSDVLFTLMRAVHEESLARLRLAAEADAEPLARVCAAIEGQVRYVVEQRTRTELFLHQVRALPAELRAEMHRCEREYADAMTALMRAAGAGDDAALAARAAIGAANAARAWFRADGDWSLERTARMVALVLVGGLAYSDQSSVRSITVPRRHQT